MHVFQVECLKVRLKQRSVDELENLHLKPMLRREYIMGVVERHRWRRSGWIMLRGLGARFLPLLPLGFSHLACRLWLDAYVRLKLERKTKKALDEWISHKEKYYVIV